MIKLAIRHIQCFIVVSGALDCARLKNRRMPNWHARGKNFICKIQDGRRHPRQNFIFDNNSGIIRYGFLILVANHRFWGARNVMKDIFDSSKHSVVIIVMLV